MKNNEPIKSYKSPVTSGPAVCLAPNSKEPVAPAGNLAVFLDALFQQTTALESHPFPGPTGPINSARIDHGKDRKE